MNETLIYIGLAVFGVLMLWFIYHRNFKRIVTPCVALICGAVKVGKSLLAVWLSMKKYRSVHRKWWIVTHIFRKDIEEPLYYTNTAVSFGSLKKKKRHRLDKNIRQIELEHLLRMKRFAYKSVCYINESSLMADNQDFNNQKRNAQLSMFNKLFGHETKGGQLYYDTQSPFDNHYSIKRVVSNYLFVQKSRNFFFFRVMYVREMINEDIGQNNFNEDVDFTTRKVLIWRWWYKKYDRYYFSYLTDRLSKRTKKPKWYKGGLVSFNPLYRVLSLRKKGDIKNEQNEKIYKSAL